MIEVNSHPKPTSPPGWHKRFLAMVPTIIQRAQFALRDGPGEPREDLVAEAVANCLVAYVRLVRRGKESVAYPTVLAMYAIRQIRVGRRVGKKINTHDVYAQQAQSKGGYRLKQLGSPRDHRGGWQEQLVDNRQTSILDQVAFRIDFPAWLNTLPSRDRKIVDDLAIGERTGDVARKYGVSAGRISQLRRELRMSWEEFIGDRPVDK